MSRLRRKRRHERDDAGAYTYGMFRTISMLTTRPHRPIRAIKIRPLDGVCRVQSLAYHAVKFENFIVYLLGNQSTRGISRHLSPAEEIFIPSALTDEADDYQATYETNDPRDEDRKEA
ncbi:MAG: hypothetical protein ACTSRC_21965 [Candidatus Helarchaeota archaeon]